MIRLTYISSFAPGLTEEDIQAIGAVSAKNNTRDHLTGALFCFRGVFYQIIEGDEEPLFRCLRRIQADPRHSDLFILNVEKDIPKRMYAQWKMKLVMLNNQATPLILPIRNLLNSLTQTHRILEKYVPTEVLLGIQKGTDPLDWDFERDQMIVLFSDLVSFTAITEVINLPEMKKLLDTYFEIASSALSSSGGRISKLTGDGFMAHYPVSKATDALWAALEIITKLKERRECSDSPFLKLAYCGIGMSAGKVVKGNVGSATALDYTVLGDVVNSASRLESYTREVGHSILFDERFFQYLKEEPGVRIRDLGEHQLKGKTKALNIYTVDHPTVPFDMSPAQVTDAVRKINV